MLDVLLWVSWSSEEMPMLERGVRWKMDSREKAR
jgi:hypothetical protein